MNRRGFLQAILAAGVAPAVVGSGILMPVRQVIIRPPGLYVGPYIFLDTMMPYGQRRNMVTGEWEPFLWGPRLTTKDIGRADWAYPR